MPIIINNININSISGPVSFHFLEPNILKFREFKKYGVHIPMIILFGDYHLSGEECDNCYCVDNECCFPVYSEDFLKLLDSLSSPTKPIDISVETFPDDETRRGISLDLLKFNIENTSMDKIIYRFKNCFIKEFRFDESCPTKNIKWHYIDARRQQRFDNKYNYEQLMTYLLDLNLVTYSEGIVLDNLLTNPKLQIININVIFNILKYFDYDFTFLVKFIESYAYLLEGNIEKFAEFHFSDTNRIFVKRSLIYKQIYKQKIPDFKSLKYWRDIFVKSVSNYIRMNLFNIKMNDNIIKMFSKVILPYLYDIIDNIKKGTYNFMSNNDIKKLADNIGINNEQFQANLEILKDYMTTTNASLLDIYYITRMLKVPEGSINPYLSVAYLGYAHTYNISYLLNEVMNLYKPVYNIKSRKNTHKCLNIPKNVILDLNLFFDKYS